MYRKDLTSLLLELGRKCTRILIYYNQNHVIEQILPKFYLNESIFGSKLDTNKTNIPYDFDEIPTR